ncbi:interleukin-17A-like [Pelobates fuscus]|uniref:interleukin-17A-like n=1 Tax=Pelobates fuscus TaxID=191477 RepID=UPI002FE49BC5
MRMHRLLPLMSLLLFFAGVVLSKRCPPSKNIHFAPGMKFDLQMNSCNHSPSYATEAHTRSLSPWEYSMNEDKNRFPAIIAEAKCTHNRCVDSTGNLDTSASSVPINQEILILRRPEGDPEGGIMLDKQLITVGCTCVWPNTHETKQN